jgi:hypothetical protein
MPEHFMWSVLEEVALEQGFTVFFGVPLLVVISLIMSIHQSPIPMCP